MTCRDLYGFLDDFLDGTLDIVVRLKFDAHLFACAKCRAYLATYEATLRAAREVERWEPPEENAPEDLIRAILAARATLTPRPLPE